jgi:hypothetical protein
VSSAFAISSVILLGATAVFKKYPELKSEYSDSPSEF